MLRIKIIVCQKFASDYLSIKIGFVYYVTTKHQQQYFVCRCYVIYALMRIYTFTCFINQYL